LYSTKSKRKSFLNLTNWKDIICALCLSYPLSVELKTPFWFKWFGEWKSLRKIKKKKFLFAITFKGKKMFFFLGQFVLQPLLPCLPVIFWFGLMYWPFWIRFSWTFFTILHNNDKISAYSFLLQAVPLEAACCDSWKLFYFSQTWLVWTKRLPFLEILTSYWSVYFHAKVP
jgi:hypothetical protein